MTRSDRKRQKTIESWEKRPGRHGHCLYWFVTIADGWWPFFLDLMLLDVRLQPKKPPSPFIAPTNPWFCLLAKRPTTSASSSPFQVWNYSRCTLVIGLPRICTNNGAFAQIRQCKPAIRQKFCRWTPMKVRWIGQSSAVSKETDNVVNGEQHSANFSSPTEI